MADCMRGKYENPKMKQSEIANQLGLSSSTLQRYRNVVIMLSPYRINTNNTNERTKKAKITNFDNNLHHETDIKRPQMTSKDLNRHQKKIVRNQKTKNNLKGGSIQENIEINEHYLDKILLNNST